MRVGSAAAQAELGNFDEAIRTIREAQIHLPGITWAHRLLASVYGQMEDIENARASARALLAAHPGLSKERLLASLPPAVTKRKPNYLAGLQAAGLL